MLAALAFSSANLAQESTVLPRSDTEGVAAALEDDAEVMSNTQLIELLIRINNEARPFALQVPLLVYDCRPARSEIRSGWAACLT